MGRPIVVDATKLAYAAHLRDAGHTITDIVAKTGIPRTSLYRHLPPRPADSVTAADRVAGATGDAPAPKKRARRGAAGMGSGSGTAERG